MPGVTKEQIQAAREADLFAWLQSHEPGVLKRDGPNYRHKEHDSLVYVTGKRYWYWNSRGRSINALDYLIQIRGYGLVDAVQALAGGEIRQTPAYQSAAAKQAQREPEKKPFTLPWARRCATAAVSYLQRRGISSDVISRCFRNGLFYEARYHGEPVCVFVGKDNAGKAKFACMRGITGNLKKDVYGSDKEFSFCYPPQNPGSRHVAVFEAPIDALSHATLQELEGWKWNGYRLSLGGTSHVALTAFLERHPEIKRVTLYMDNDLGGLTKVAAGLTKRQLICFSLAALVGLPVYFLTRGAIGNSAAVLLMIGLMMPFFFFAMYEKDGQPAEKLLRNRLRYKLWPKDRPYRTENFYKSISKKEVSQIAKNQTAGGAGKTSAKKRKAGKKDPHRSKKGRK